MKKSPQVHMRTPALVNRLSSSLLFLLPFLIGSNLQGDVLILRNGERFIGTVISQNTQEVVFKSDFAGEITVPGNQVVRLEVDAEETIAEAPSRGFFNWLENFTFAKPKKIPSSSPPGEDPAEPLFQRAEGMAPPPDQDWILIYSGEWLTGEVKALQDETLEFDSEELDEVSFDWGDIDRLIMSTPTTIGLDDRSTRYGLLEVDPNEVFLAGTEADVFPRSRVRGITPGGKSEWDFWSGEISIGVTVFRGNTNQTDSQVRVELERRTPRTRFRSDFISNRSRQDDIEFTDNQRLTAEYDTFLSERFFLRLPSYEWFRDPFQNVASRNTLSVRAGYDIVDRSKMSWDVTLGPGYQWVERISVQPGQELTSESGSAVVTTNFEWDITNRIEYNFSYTGQFTDSANGSDTHHSVSTFEIELTNLLELDLSLIWDRVSNPQPDEDGIVPDQDDIRFVTGLGLDF